MAATNPFKTPVYGQNSAPSPGRVIGANDRIAVGYIGIGGPPSNCPGMGLAHVDSQKSHAAENNIAQAAVCDLYKKRNEIAKEKIGAGDVTTHDDYRKLLERKDIDAVVIATHDPWHAQCAIDAMEAGKHVYCEKPMTRYLDEAFLVHDAVKRTGKVDGSAFEPCSLREKSYSVATPFLQQRWGRFLSIFFKTRSGFCITSIANVTVSPRSKLAVSMESMRSRSH